MEKDKLAQRVTELQKDLLDLNQYNRRENIKIAHIPESVTQENLEEYCLKILNSITDLEYGFESYDIAGIHRLGKFKHTGKPRNVIIRFTNRKHAHDALNNSHKLKYLRNYKMYFITENLCPTYRRMFNKLYALKKKNVLYDVYTYNGIIFARKNEQDNDITKFRTPEELDEWLQVNNVS